MKKLVTILMVLVSAWGITADDAASLQQAQVSPSPTPLPLSQSTPAEAAFDLRDHPVYLLASYYNAINLRDYARAYNYWNGNEPRGATLAQFADGFADTDQVQLWVRLPIAVGAAAGSAYAEVPVLLEARSTEGDEQIFAGCFVTSRSNVPVGNATKPDPNWHLYDASLEASETLSFSQDNPDCTLSESFPPDGVWEDTTHPIDLIYAYYDAIARRDFVRAYNYREGELRDEETLQEFSQGFADTSEIRLVVAPPFRVDAAAGSVYAEVPVLVSALENNTPQYFVGCFVARKSNVPVGSAAEPDPNWHLASADITEVESMEAGLRGVAAGCPEG